MVAQKSEIASDFVDESIGSSSDSGEESDGLSLYRFLKKTDQIPYFKTEGEN